MRGRLLALLWVPVLSLYGQLPDAPAASAYAGDAACRACHQQVFEEYQGSAHHLASSLPSRASVDGKFTPGSNVLRTSNPALYFVMSSTSEGYFQRAVAQFPALATISRQERFDLVIGAGRKGQTSLYWKGDELFELPVTYWTETDGWINSPGYTDGLPNFDKPIVPRCLECHATSIQSLPPPANRFDRTTAVLGITCEKCHGPGRAHVGNKQANSIINPAKLSRERQMDLCGLCHAGPGKPRAPAFSFVAGSVLKNYLDIPADVDAVPTDVHAHQLQLLESSRCFRSSDMTCSTCHDVHKPQRDPALFSEKCLACHKVESCGKYATLGARILTRCADCHMPLRESNVIVFDAGGKRVQPRARSHRIAIYQDAEP